MESLNLTLFRPYLYLLVRFVFRLSSSSNVQDVVHHEFQLNKLSTEREIDESGALQSEREANRNGKISDKDDPSVDFGKEL